MSKKFFEVFPTLQLDKKMTTLLENTVVERVTSNRAKDRLRIYLESDHLLQKEIIWEVEMQIKNQLFRGQMMEIKVQEKYRLSSQYTLENLMESYRDSMLLEIQKYSHVLHSMLKQAKIVYPGPGCMALEVGDTVLYRDMQGELIRILEKIIVERCGISASLSLKFVERESDHYRKEVEIMIRRRVEEISGKVAAALAEKECENAENVKVTAKADTAESEKQSAKKKEVTTKKEEEKKQEIQRGAGKENKGKG